MVHKAISMPKESLTLGAECIGHTYGDYPI